VHLQFAEMCTCKLYFANCRCTLSTCNLHLCSQTFSYMCLVVSSQTDIGKIKNHPSSATNQLHTAINHCHHEISASSPHIPRILPLHPCLGGVPPPSLHRIGSCVASFSRIDTKIFSLRSHRPRQRSFHQQFCRITPSRRDTER
jgi:hypothetical protein